MAFIAFLGCDGSGKSAVIAGVRTALEAQGVRVTTGHWRPVAFSNGNQLGAQGNADDPHGIPPRGTLSSIAKLAWLWCNWWAAWCRQLGKEARSGMVLYDRYHIDLTADPRRYRYGGPDWLARLASKLMPQPDQVVYLDASPEVLLSRKREVSTESLEKNRATYLRIAKGHSRFRIVDASRPLEKVIGDVVDGLP
ncbi:MAG: thymidylate kinase [Alphaproteobacteria bacterium]|nr:MAG: thymidylate kinase [Alphaproteobacteria bacterium]